MILDPTPAEIVYHGSHFTVAGNVLMEVHRATTGDLIHSERSKNLVVTDGRNIIRDLMLNVGNAPNTMAVGKGASITTASMTRLEDEQFRAIFTRKTATNAKATFQLLLGTGDANVSPQTLGEVGIFSGASYNSTTATIGGLMFARTTFTPIAKDNTMTITYTWEVTVGS